MNMKTARLVSKKDTPEVNTLTPVFLVFYSNHGASPADWTISICLYCDWPPMGQATFSEDRYKIQSGLSSTMLPQCLPDKSGFFRGNESIIKPAEIEKE
ncbi:hypothetical protein BaRGS_00012552 [Batillaria attramentaria]|uniref:Uncharacterized protein n=1 Tax=Batillaria attramentaria TaxID=370345 RepID=A0ABD0L9H5_9CAEN